MWFLFPTIGHREAEGFIFGEDVTRGAESVWKDMKRSAKHG